MLALVNHQLLTPAACCADHGVVCASPSRLHLLCNPDTVRAAPAQLLLPKHAAGLLHAVSVHQYSTVRPPRAVQAGSTSVLPAACCLLLELPAPMSTTQQSISTRQHPTNLPRAFRAPPCPCCCGGIMPGLHSDNLAVVAAAALGCVVYTGLVGMTLWSYLACFMTQPGHVPPGWHPFQDAEVGPAGCPAGGCVEGLAGNVAGVS